MSSEAPKVLVINYDENKKSPTKDKIKEIVDKLCNVKPDIFVLTTQDSPSGTKSHIQHSIKEEIKNSKKPKYLRNNTGDELILQNYDLFSKIDATRESNVKSKGLTDELYNCRTRIWINNETTYKGFTKNFSEKSFTETVFKPYTNNNGILYNQNYKTSNGTEIKDTTTNSNIKISKYLYRRITNQGSNGKNGMGSIMISLCLEKIVKDKIQTYQYIICNSNPKKTKDIIKGSMTTKKAFIHMIQEGNVMRYNKPRYQGFSSIPSFKGNLFILYVSKDNCVFKKIENEPEYKLEEVKSLLKLKNLMKKNQCFLF